MGNRQDYEYRLSDFMPLVGKRRYISRNKQGRKNDSYEYSFVETATNGLTAYNYITLGIFGIIIGGKILEKLL